MNFKKLLTASAMSLMAVSAVAGLTSCKKEKNVVFWHTMGKSSQDILNGYIKAFNEERVKNGKEEIKIEHAAQGGYSDIKAKLIKAIPAKTTPTMAYCYPDHVADYLTANAVVNLDDLVNDPEIGLSAEEKEDYSMYWGEGTGYNQQGTCYSVPFSKSTEVVFYNADAYAWYKEKGYLNADTTVPTKWINENDPDDQTTMLGVCKIFKEHFKEYYVAKVAPEASADAINAAYNEFAPLGYDSDSNMFITLMKQFGYNYTSLNEDNTGNFDLIGADRKGTAETRKIVKMVKAWYDAGYLVTQGTLGNGQYTSTYFTNQKCFMSIGSTGGTSYNKSDAFDVRVAAIPQQDQSNPAVIQQGPSIVFFKNKKISEQQIRNSWEFYKYITNAENSAVFSISTGYEPVRKSSYFTETYTDGHSEDDLYTRVANLTKTLTNSYYTSPAFVGSATARDEVGGIISNVCLRDDGSMTLDALMDKYISEAATRMIYSQY